MLAVAVLAASVVTQGASAVNKFSSCFCPGGWGQLKQNKWPDTNDPGYKKLLDLVHATIVPTNGQDINGTCNPKTCVCGCCWVREAETLTTHTAK